MPENNIREIIPDAYAIKSMRDSGYRNTAYAIAELIDNSIQAGEKNVQLLCTEKKILTKSKKKISRVSEIAVLDDGTGMDKETLWDALLFGKGTNLTREKQKGIGKFGMGLPNSSISQARHVEVWSWQDGFQNSIYTFLNVDQVMAGKQKGIPEPAEKKIPSLWKKILKINSKSGTLVLWSDLDYRRLTWKTGVTILEKSASEIGRIYRRFIDRDKLNIMLKIYDKETKKIIYDEKAKPNDPMQLMTGTISPEYSQGGIEAGEPIFEPYPSSESYQKTFNYEKASLRVSLSVAKDAARKSTGKNPGDYPHGKHAKRNLGVSILRADRELHLDTSWANQYEPTERWWGVEVDFPSEFDEVFGVSNNKQSANTFTSLGKLDLTDLEDRYVDAKALRDSFKENEQLDDLVLYEVAIYIKKQLSQIRSYLDKQTSGTRTVKGDTLIDQKSPELKGTRATEKRKEENIIGRSDEQKELLSKEEKEHELTSFIQEEGEIDQTKAKEEAKLILKSPTLFSFGLSTRNSTNFFEVNNIAGLIRITLFQKHPAFQLLDLSGSRDVNELNSEQLKEKIQTAEDGIKLLIESWARMEDEALSDKRLNELVRIREDWGRMAMEFFQEE